MARPLPKCVSNYWLNAIIFNDKSDRDSLLSAVQKNVRQ